jgi:hypothetical protein
MSTKLILLHDLKQQGREEILKGIIYAAAKVAQVTECDRALKWATAAAQLAQAHASLEGKE